MNTKNLKKIILAISIISISIFLISSISTATRYDYYFCIQSECITTFSKEFEGSILILKTAAGLIALITTVYSIFIALETYTQTSKINKLNTHISQLNLFKDQVKSEIESNRSISEDSIDHLNWYLSIFKNPIENDFSTSEAYLNKINKISSLINTANKNDKNFKYKDHQHALIKEFGVIGIKIDFMPRRDFQKIECSIIELINKINKQLINIEIEIPTPSYI